MERWQSGPQYHQPLTELPAYRRQAEQANAQDCSQFVQERSD